MTDMTAITAMLRRDALDTWVRWYLRHAHILDHPQSLCDLALAALARGMTPAEYLDAYAPHTPDDLAREISREADVYWRHHADCI